ncbi:zeta toxin family protein, partial [Enterococcus faecium]|uniref:zeta toxin family protein n=1 Tax=Enterococcus faecium TaxID=1352 RepID=UPI0033907574
MGNPRLNHRYRKGFYSLFKTLQQNRYNLVIEGTGRTTDVPIQTATMLQAKGYETKMYVMAVPKINSYLG